MSKILYSILKEIVEKREEDITLIELMKRVLENANILNTDEFAGSTLAEFGGNYIIIHDLDGTKVSAIELYNDHQTAQDHFEKIIEGRLVDYFTEEMEKFIEKHIKHNNIFEIFPEVADEHFRIRCPMCNREKKISIIDKKYSDSYHYALLLALSFVMIEYEAKGVLIIPIKKTSTQKNKRET